MKRVMLADPDEDPIQRWKQRMAEMDQQSRKQHDDVIREIRETQKQIAELIRQAEERRKKSSQSGLP